MPKNVWRASCLGKRSWGWFVVAETITWLGEMKIALKAIKDAGLIAVCIFSIKRNEKTRDGYTPGDACKI